MDLVVRSVRMLAVIVLLLTVCSHADVISYLRFEEGSGYGAWDETGLMNGEVLNFSDVSPGGGDTGPQGWSVSVPSPIVPLTGEPNTGSIRYAGGSAFIDLSNFNALSLGTEFTIELFMKPDQPVIISPMFGFSPVSALSLSLTVSQGNMNFSSQFMNEQTFIPATGVETGVWQHVALVKELGEYSIYLDGSLVDNPSLPAGTDGPYWFPGTGTTGDRTFGDGFRGWLDEFRISDEALTPDQFLNAIPEPSTFILTLLGLATWWAARRKPNNSRKVKGVP